MLFALNSHAQSIDPAAINQLPPQKQEEAKVYLKQAKTANITAWSLLIGGAVMLSVATYLANGSGLEDPYYDDGNDEASAAFVLAGLGSAAISIPFFIKVHKKRDKVRYMLYENRKVYLSPRYSPATHTAGIKLVIPI